MNVDEDRGRTLSFQLVERLQARGRVLSMILFTGTPHRGKNFGFLAMLQLLRPDLFNPRQSAREQFKRLPRVMIRNNKQCVTDLHGRRLFRKPLVTPVEYDYSPAEQSFYNKMTEFITSGQAYASTLSASDQSAVILVLIAMQKLASSSIAAIRRSLKGRAERLAEGKARLRKALDESERRSLGEARVLAEEGETDSLNDTVEEVVKVRLQLMENEHARLLELIESASRVTEETKIERIISLTEEFPPEESVLFFTEYKATQAHLVSRLIQTFGSACTAFINGDSRLEGVADASGVQRTLQMRREDASERFNSGNAYNMELTIRLSNRAVGASPSGVLPLFGGGAFNGNYNQNREPITFTVPEDVESVHLVAFITGHGFGVELDNCAEFCDHTHQFEVNGVEFVKQHVTAGSAHGCLRRVSEGVVPNQYGTWPYGRGGWCPGLDVEPWVADVTDALQPGENVITYRGLLMGNDYHPVPVVNPGGGFGARIDLTSYLVFWR